MTAFEWVALVGAAAWIPHIATLIYRAVVRPRVIIIPVPQIEIGYNFLGPILNMKAALFAERKDAIVIQMEVHLKHEKGREIVLQWQSFVETFSELRSQAGERAEFSRDQDATALKLPTVLPVEKFIRFQDLDFQARANQLSTAADAEFNRSEQSGTPAAFLTSHAFNDLVRFYKHGFCWEAGRYEMTLRIHLMERGKPVVARTSFTLSQSEVEKLGANVPTIEESVRQIAQGVEAGERVLPKNWATPQLASKKIMVRT